MKKAVSLIVVVAIVACFAIIVQKFAGNKNEGKRINWTFGEGAVRSNWFNEPTEKGKKELEKKSPSGEMIEHKLTKEELAWRDKIAANNNVQPWATSSPLVTCDANGVMSVDESFVKMIGNWKQGTKVHWATGDGSFQGNYFFTKEQTAESLSQWELKPPDVSGKPWKRQLTPTEMDYRKKGGLLYGLPVILSRTPKGTYIGNASNPRDWCDASPVMGSCSSILYDSTNRKFPCVLVVE